MIYGTRRTLPSRKADGARPEKFPYSRYRQSPGIYRNPLSLRRLRSRYTNLNGLPTEVVGGVGEGLKYDSAIRCDELLSIPKSKLTNFIGSLSEEKLDELNEALKFALDIK